MFVITQRSRVFAGCGAALLVGILFVATVTVRNILRGFPRGPDMALDRKDDPIIYAINVGDVNRVKDLLKSGADYNARYSFGSARTMWALPIHLAAAHGQAEIVQLLLDAGADPNALDGVGDSPLIFICRHFDDHGIEECAKLLIRAGATLDACGPHGNTPLEIAIGYSIPRVDLAKTLLASGADPNAPGSDGTTPAHVACGVLCNNSNDPQLAIEKIRLLKRAGADFHKKDNSGKTAYDLLKECGFTWVVDDKDDNRTGKKLD
jgi:ankyrin repeat protein